MRNTKYNDVSFWSKMCSEYKLESKFMKYQIISRHVIVRMLGKHKFMKLTKKKTKFDGQIILQVLISFEKKVLLY